MNHPYLPNTDVDRAAMMDRVGVASLDALFGDIPAEVRYPKLNLPAPVSEQEILAELKAMSWRNASTERQACFLGAGAYHHCIPSTVSAITGRAEFYTAYTPYQPEISQGTLQAIFEYQSMVCQLYGMEVANASHYDGATAVAEAAIMALNTVTNRRQILVSPGVHPEYRATLRTYLQGLDVEIVGDENPSALATDLIDQVSDETACLIVQSPSFYGCIEDVASLAEPVHSHGALLAVSANPISLGMLTPPGDQGADIATGEGQPLGVSLSAGGPYLGIFTTRNRYVRKMAGRLVGQTVDNRGQRGFVLTLSTREQHIRREQATSNICSNEALCALAAGVYLATMGRAGMRRVAELCYHKAHYAAKLIGELPGFEMITDRPFFNEFVVRCPEAPERINRRLLEAGIIGGYDLGKVHPMLEGQMLFCVTEMNTREEIERLVRSLRN
jgi:glycine dehydrogenase subunit 1